jgi:hypothetical protein
MKVFPANEIGEAGQIGEQGAPGDTQLRKFPQNSIVIRNSKSDLFDTKLLLSAILSPFQPNSLMHQILTATEDDESAFLGGNPGMHRGRLNRHRMLWDQRSRVFHALDEPLQRRHVFGRILGIRKQRRRPLITEPVS